MQILSGKVGTGSKVTIQKKRRERVKQIITNATRSRVFTSTKFHKQIGFVGFVIFRINPS